MTSKISFPERWQEYCRIYRWSLKKNIGMMALLTVLLFIGLPMVLLVQLPNSYQSLKTVSNMSDAERLQELARGYEGYLHTVVPVFAASLLLLFAIVLCIRLFSYMQNKRSVDLFHALPVGRVPMLLGHWCAGLTVLIVPVLFNFGILALIAAAYGIPASAGSIGLAAAMFWLLLMSATALTFCMFMAVCSGNTIDTMLSILGVNAGFPLLLISCMYLINQTVPGMNIPIKNHISLIALLAPFVSAYLPFFGVNGWFLPWWLFLTAAMLAGSCLLYRRRKSEGAEDQFAFPIPKVVIRFLLTASGGIWFGLLLSAISNSFVGFLLGVLVGSAVVHAIIEAIYSRGFRHLKKSIAGYAVFVGVFAVFYAVIGTGCFGYDTWVPNASEVESVTVDTGYANYYGGSKEIYDANQQFLMNLSPVLTSADGLKTVTEVHRNIISLYRSDGFPYYPHLSPGNDKLTYKLKNGKTVQRTLQYPLGYKQTYAKFGNEFKKIISLSEYQQGNDIIFFIEPNDIQSIAFYNGNDSKTIVPIDSAKKELLDGLKQNYPKNILEDAKDAQKKKITVDFKKEIEPKSAKLKQQLGSYNGKVCLYSGEYRYESGDVVDQLVQKMGWNK